MYPELEKKELPQAPKATKAIGVGVVVMGLAIGTGELILWPHLVTKYGLGILWAALVGISFQYFINQEVARLALATGESFFTFSARIFKWFVPFWLFSAIILYIWPGWAGAIGTTLSELFGFGNYIFWAWISLALLLVLTFSGKIAYNLLEKSLKIIIPTFFILLLITSFLVLKLSDIKNAFIGLINFGWIPKEIDINVFFGAIIFAGAGGLLNLCTSLWYRDKGSGMGKYIGKIVNPITGKTEAVATTGYTFEINSQNIEEWKKWMKFVKIDQGVIFWFLGLLTLVLLSLNAYVILTPLGLIPEGTQVAVVQAHIFEKNWGKIGFDLFLIMAFLMLFSVMWTVIDAFTRIITDILYVNSRVGPFKKYLSWLEKISIHHLYYGLITGIVLISGLLLTFKQPLILLTISAVLGGFTMAIYTPLLLYINNKKLPKPLRPGIITNIFLFLASIFYIIFSFVILLNTIK